MMWSVALIIALSFCSGIRLYAAAERADNGQKTIGHVVSLAGMALVIAIHVWVLSQVPIAEYVEPAKIGSIRKATP